ncbi:hypothetical protein BJV77DRAFT_978030 [Russula vinacea]|nr:hypothetical protein BJV77DRAFT_978030 [Russula vinacea]
MMSYMQNIRVDDLSVLEIRIPECGADFAPLENKNPITRSLRPDKADIHRLLLPSPHN